MSFPVTFAAVVSADNTKRSAAISIVDQPRVRELRSIFSSVVVEKVFVQVWMQKSFGRIYLVGPYPNITSLPTTAAEVLLVPHAKMLASSNESDVIHSFDLPTVPLEYDLAVVPIRSGHPDVWFGLGSNTGSGVQGTSIVVRIEVTVSCSGHSFGILGGAISSFNLGVSDSTTQALEYKRVNETELPPREEDGESSGHQNDDTSTRVTRGD